MTVLVVVDVVAEVYRAREFNVGGLEERRVHTLVYPPATVVEDPRIFGCQLLSDIAETQCV